MLGPFEGVGSVERRLRLINAMEMMGAQRKKKGRGRCRWNCLEGLWLGSCVACDKRDYKARLKLILVGSAENIY